MKIFKGNTELISNNIAIELRVLGEEDAFSYDFVYVKILFFICTVEGKTIVLI